MTTRVFGPSESTGGLLVWSFVDSTNYTRCWHRTRTKKFIGLVLLVTRKRCIDFTSKTFELQNKYDSLSSATTTTDAAIEIIRALTCYDMIFSTVVPSRLQHYFRHQKHMFGATRKPSCCVRTVGSQYRKDDALN